MRIALIAATVPLLAAAGPPELRAEACRAPADTIAARQPARPRKLGELPPGRPWRAVYRLENGCPTPVALPTANRPR